MDAGAAAGASGSGGGAGPSSSAGAGAPPALAAAGGAAADAGVDRNVHPSGIVPQLQNVVATVNFGVPLDLKQIALHARNAEYNPKRFAAVIMRIREPKTTALIFGSGKMVCTGAKSEADARLAARKYCRIVQKLGFQEAEFQEFKIQNIVGSCDVRFPIRLEGLAYAHGYFATYEPELFPGLIYRMKQPKIVLLVFVSGKVVLTGAKHRSEIYQAFENIYPTLTEFRKQDAGAGMAALQSAAAQAAAAHAQAQAGAAAAGGGGAQEGGGEEEQPRHGQQQQQAAGGGGAMRPPPRRAPAAAAAMPPPAATPAFALAGAATALPPPAATPAFPHGHHGPGGGLDGAPSARPMAPAPLAPPPPPATRR